MEEYKTVKINRKNKIQSFLATDVNDFMLMSVKHFFV